MTVRERCVGDVTIIDVGGRITEDGAVALRALVQPLVHQGRVKIVFDLQKTPYMDTTALGEIVRRLKVRHIEVLLCGMRAAPNFGPDYVRAFDAIYPELAAANDLVFYPFFLDGIVADPKLNIGDGLHPTGEGVARIVTGILPKVEALLARVRAKPAS